MFIAFIPESVSFTKGGTFSPADSQATPSRYPINICQMNRRMKRNVMEYTGSADGVESQVETRGGECKSEYTVPSVERRA